MSKLDKIKQLIKKEGLTTASKISGLPRYELVRITDYPIDNVIANLLLWDMMDDNLIPKNYKNSKLFYSDSEGVLYWKTDIIDKVGIVEISTMATPFWDGSEYTPVETDWVVITDTNGDLIIDAEGGGEYFDTLISRTKFDGIEDLLTWFKHFYLPKTSEIIQKQFEKFKVKHEMTQ